LIVKKKLDALIDVRPLYLLQEDNHSKSLPLLLLKKELELKLLFTSLLLELEVEPLKKFYLLLVSKKDPVLKLFFTLKMLELFTELFFPKLSQTLGFLIRLPLRELDSKKLLSKVKDKCLIALLHVLWKP